jgi:hypothetical protein
VGIEVGWESSGIEPANECMDVRGNKMLVFGLNSSSLDSDPVNNTCKLVFINDEEFLDWLIYHYLLKECMKTRDRGLLLLVLYGASYRHTAGASSLLQKSSASKTIHSKYITHN